MESYTYLFLFVLQLVFTVVVLLTLLHEKRLQKQLEKKNKQLLTELLNLREEIQAMRSTYLTFTGKIVRISVSTTTASEELKKLISATEKLKKRTGKNQSSSFQDHKETTSQAETVVTRKSDVKQQSQEKEKVTNGCSLWTFLKFMFFFLSFCLVHDNWGGIKSFIRRLWKK